MLRRLLMRAAGKLAARPVRRRIAAFHLACKTPEVVQATLLREILGVQAGTGFGEFHKFRDCLTIADFRRNVPVAPYEYLAPYVERVMQGDVNALLANGPVIMFGLTSGSTAKRKHIPINQAYLDDYRRGWNIWGLSAISDHKSILMKPVMQLVGDPEEFRSPSGIPCGNVSGFTAQVQKRIVKFLYSVPAITGKIHDSAVRYYVALRFSLPRKVGLLTSANPSTLVALARVMNERREELIRDIHDGTLKADLAVPEMVRLAVTPKLKKNPERAKELEAFIRRDGALLPSAAWPAESLLIGCWTGGSVGPYLRQLPQYYGETPIRDLGLLASEGRMTIPLTDHSPSGVIDITSHYFEFIPEGEFESEQRTVLGAHELEVGKSYYILLTTKAGLYRYHISDLVRCTGYHHGTATVEFLGKGNRFANLTGEKLSEYQVTRACDAAAQELGQPITAYAMAPCWDDKQPYYGFFLEAQDAADRCRFERFLAAIDVKLHAQNTEYASKRESNRLGPIRGMVIPEGHWKKWDRERLEKNGGSPEQYKHPCLIGDVNFRTTMPVISEPEA